MKRMITLSFLMFVAAAPATTQSSSEVELRHIIAMMRDQIVVLKAENAALKAQLRSAGAAGATQAAIVNKTFSERAEQAIKHGAPYTVSRGEVEELRQKAKKMDAEVTAYLAAHQVAADIADFIKAGKVEPGVPIEAARIYCASYTTSKTESAQMITLTAWEPFGLASTEDSYDVEVTDGVIRSVSVTSSPYHGVQFDPRH